MNRILVPPSIDLVRRIPFIEEKGVIIPNPPKVSAMPVKPVRKAVKRPRKPVERIKRPRKPSSRVYVLKTHCINGHALIGDNLYYPKKGRRLRECRACIKARVQKYRSRALVVL